MQCFKNQPSESTLTHGLLDQTMVETVVIKFIF